MGVNRIRVGPFDEVLLVPWHALERSIDRARALLLAKAMLDDPASIAELRRLLQPTPTAVALDDAASIERLADLLASGSLMLVHLPRREPAWRPPHFTRGDVAGGGGNVPLLSELRPSSERPSKSATWIEIRCVGIAGAAYAGAPVQLRLPTAEVVEARLDAGSSLRLDTIASAGSCRLQMLATAKRSGTVPLGERPEISGREPRIRRGGPAVALATGARHVVIVEAGHGFSC